MKELGWFSGLKAHHCFMHLPGGGSVPVLGALGLAGVGLDLLLWCRRTSQRDRVI